MIVEEVHPQVFFDISIGNDAVGRIVISLFSDKAPNATAAFTSHLPHFTGQPFNRVLKNFMIQCKSDASDETTTLDENKDGDVDKPFVVCLAGSSPSQFFITTYKSPHLKGKHIVLGEVVHGKSVVRAVENVNTNKDHVPVETEQVTITKCGEWNEGDELPVFNACYDPIGGDIYEEFPDDDLHIDKELSQSAFKAASIIKNSGAELFKLGQWQNALLKYMKSLRYVTEYFPDMDQEPEFYAKYTELKKKLYLNLCLVHLKLKNYNRCRDFGGYVLSMKATDQEKAKTLYRLGCTLIETHKYDEAIDHLSKAQKIAGEGDKAIEKELARAQQLSESKKKAEKARYAKFFS